MAELFIRMRFGVLVLFIYFNFNNVQNIPLKITKTLVDSFFLWEIDNSQRFVLLLLSYCDYTDLIFAI